MWAAVYGTLAFIVLATLWRDENLRTVAVALVASWAASNIATYYFSPGERPPFYTVTEVAIAVSAFIALELGGSRALAWLLGVSALSIASNIAYDYVASGYGPDAPPKALTIRWQIATSVCFATECALALIARWRSNGRLDLRSLVRRMAAALGRQPETETER